MKLIWSEPALRDLLLIRDYIAKDSEFYAARFIAKIVGAAESLTKFPRMGRIVPEFNNEAVRELVIHSYRILYEIETGQISINAIVHSRRDLRKKPRSWEIG
jgi:plasmid stabilization system protein ParE